MLVSKHHQDLFSNIVLNSKVFKQLGNETCNINSNEVIVHIRHLPVRRGYQAYSALGLFSTDAFLSEGFSSIFETMFDTR